MKPSNEPVVGLVLGLVAAGVALLVAFGVDISPEQGAAIAGFVAAALGLGLYVRSKVTPLANPKRRKADAGLSLLEVLVVLLVVAVVLILVGVL